ncbi:MAG TPA: acylphosphatase [Gammaproteobacteria bacterium]
MKICRRCYVSGKVQGVFFRAATRDRAQSLHVTGHAKNLEDGRVEVLACGEEENVAALIEWLWQGPRLARVDRVDVEDADGAAPPEFRTA